MKKVTLFLLVLSLLAGCQAAPPEDGPRDKTSVTVVMPPTSEPEAGFDPAFGWGAGEHVHEPLIQSTLTVTNPDLTIGYDLATGMEASEDGLTWTVSIRDDAKFTDGTPLTAADAAFTYNTVKTTSSVNDFTMLDYADAVDDTTVVFHMTRPFSIWPYTMAIVGIVPEHTYDPAVYGSNPIGSGRYILKQWDRGQQVILEANPDYYGEPPRMERVVILFMEEDAAFLAVQAGQADLAYTSAAYSDQSVNGYSLLSVQTVDNRGINLPVWNNALTSDPLVRHAINLGLDRQAMIDHVLSGYGTPAYSVCDAMPWWYSAAQVSDNPEQAKNVLDSAGWLPGADGVREKDGVRASLTVHYAAGDSVRQGLAAELANQLRELGIETNIKGVGWDTAYDDALSNPLVWGWGAHTPMELYNIYHTAPNSDSARYSPYSNAAVDDLMEAALACPGLEESYTLWQAAQEEIAKDVPWVWLVNVDHLYWVREGLEIAEQKIHPHGHGWSVVNNVDQWSWT
ncbi:ABC transporter substrate-binding protein [Flintibacter muris]|uniref:ABC transporter substrate-binding protein n=1 Tax=Flintibacter muris TaxID=2941327 RepID=UPI002042408C|nr:ABC transporter substrate-binding protein [Flintibacter muris]